MQSEQLREEFKVYYFIGGGRMDFFKRIGTDRHKFKLEFFIKKLTCSAKFKGDIFITAKRGEHKVTTENKRSLKPDGTCDFQRQILAFDSITLFYDQEKKAYQQKQGQIRVVIVTEKGDKKLLGTLEFDAAYYANSGKENYQQSRKFGEKIKMVLDFDVYIKCLGEASEADKSVSKKDEKEKKPRQSSMSKFLGFFHGEEEKKPDSKKDAKSPKKQEKKNKQSQQRKKGTSKEAPVNKPGKDKSRNKQIFNSEKRVSAKKKRNKSGSSDDEKQFDSNSPRNSNELNTKQRNKVAIKKGETLTDYEPSKEDEKLKKRNTDQMQPIYFDDPKSMKKNQKNNSDVDETAEDREKHIKMKRTQKVNVVENGALSGNAKNANSKAPEKYPDPDLKANNKMAELENSSAKLLQQNAKYKTLMSEYEERIRKYEKQNKKLAKENEKMVEQVSAITEQKQKLAAELAKKQSASLDSRALFQTQRDATTRPPPSSDQSQKIRQLEHDKGELLTKLQNLQHKYDKDFKQYEEVVDKYEEEKKDQEDASRGELKRLKEECLGLKDKYDKLFTKYEQKVEELKKSKYKQNQLNEQLAEAMNNLSVTKLRIGDKLNEANEAGDKSMIDVLTLLAEGE